MSVAAALILAVTASQPGVDLLHALRLREISSVSVSATATATIIRAERIRREDWNNATPVAGGEAMFRQHHMRGQLVLIEFN